LLGSELALKGKPSRFVDRVSCFSGWFCFSGLAL
jgi:hypothetical protein